MTNEQITTTVLTWLGITAGFLAVLYFVIRYAVLSAWRQIEHERLMAERRATKLAAGGDTVTSSVQQNQ